MIKPFALIVTFLSTWSLVSAQKGHDIKFQVNGLHGGDAIVAFYYGENQRALDTITFNEKGMAEMKGDKKVDNGIYLLVLPNRSYFEFVIPSDDQEFTVIADTSLRADLQGSKGSRDNEAFIKYQQFAQDLAINSQKLRDQLKNDSTLSNEDKDKLREEIISIGKMAVDQRIMLRKEYEGTFISKVWRSIEEVEIPEELKDDTTGARFLYYRDHYWDNYDLTDDGFIRTPFYHDRMVYYLTKMYSQIPDTVVKAIDKLTGMLEQAGGKELFKYTVWWTTKHYEDSKIMCMDLVLHHMAKNFYCAGRCFWSDSSTVAKMCEHAEKVEKQLCGQIAPDMTLWDTTFMHAYTLSQLDAPVIVVVFWDHECGHCKKEIPKINAMMDSMAAKGVIVYAVYTQGDWEGWKKYLHKNKIKFLNVMDAFNKSTYRKDYNIISTPQLYVLDKNKRIRFKQVPADNLAEIINYILEEQGDTVKSIKFDEPDSKKTIEIKNKTIIQMTKLSDGTYEVPCTVNGVKLKFIFDTGASNVSISLAEAVFMFKNGYLNEDDIIGSANYSIANGEFAQGTIIRIKQLEIQGLTLYNVEATIMHSLNAPLLLGQSAISRLGKIQIDPNNSTLTIVN